MWTVIKSFFGGISAQVWGVLTAIAAGAIAVTAIFQQGKKSQSVDELKTVAKDEQQAQVIRNNNATLGSNAAAKQLSDRWSR